MEQDKGVYPLEYFDKNLEHFDLVFFDYFEHVSKINLDSYFVKIYRQVIF